MARTVGGLYAKTNDFLVVHICFIGIRKVWWGAKPVLKSWKITRMTEPTNRPELPDRLSVDPRSPHHIAAVFEHDIGIRFNDKERFDVEEYSISEGWVRVPVAKTRDRKGNPLVIKIKGKVEAFYK
jgi:hypothetical protein